MAESSRKRQRIPAEATLTARHKDRVDLLESFTMMPLRILDFSILRALEWEAEVQGHLEAVGWEFLNYPHPKIYPTATKEFLATVGITESENAHGTTSYMVSFWMAGGYRTLTLDEFNIQAGFYGRQDMLNYRDAICDWPDHLTVIDMWREITGQVDYHPGIKGTRLPRALRICHKLLTGSIHARPKSPESITKQDLLALYCMVTRQKANPGYFFIEHVKNLGTREGDARRGYIQVASLLSRLAETWGCPDGVVMAELAPKPINASTLLNMKLIIRAGRSYVPAPAPAPPQQTLNEMLEEIEFTMPDSPQEQPPQAEPSGWQQARAEDRAYMDMRFDALQRQLEDLSIFLHSRFPDPQPPQDPPQDEE